VGKQAEGEKGPKGTRGHPEKGKKEAKPELRSTPGGSSPGTILGVNGGTRGGGERKKSHKGGKGK